MDRSKDPISKDLVLIGGGHSHAIALRMFGMKPLPGVRLTLISEQSDTPYSGMLPGYVAGFYSYEECHIDLRQLCQFAGAQFYCDRVIGLDPASNQIICANRPPIRFDLLSLDIGSTPKMPTVLGNPADLIPVKPVRQFLQHWQRIVDEISSHPHKPVSLGIVGGGTGGVELALNMQSRIRQIQQHQGSKPDLLTIHLVHRDEELMPGHNRWVRQYFQKLLTQRGIQLHLQEEVREVKRRRLICKSELELNCDYIFWVTQAAAPSWPAEAGLRVDGEGFVQVDDSLRSLSHPLVFAAGDIATMVNYPRPKAGVFAVRQGKPLFDNLRQTLQEQPTRAFHPQKQYLSLIGTGDRLAVASRGSWGWRSPLVWRWKDRIDRAFMRQFIEFPEMQTHPRSTTSVSLSKTPLMHCAGCGAKVGSSILERTLQRIQRDFCSPLLQSHTLIGLGSADDAAVVRVPADRLLVQTVDYFPALLNDPFLFGQIATNHALSDLFAMGATPQSALAIATLPYAQSAQLEETLYQLLSGAIKVLYQAQAELVGGHTTAAADLAFGLSCNGFAEPERLLRKGGMQPGQVLILTKAIGTGTLFAGQMQRQVKARWIDGAITSMLQSNQQAARCFQDWGVTACTDVTGFGLAGHLLEMIRASTQVAVTLNLEAIPLLEGALETTVMAITSSLYAENSRALQFIQNKITQSPRLPLLFDPQTSGGLLAAVPREMGDRCLTALRENGYSHSTIIGEVHSPQPGSQPITLTP
jgi:selenide,water dikinase